MRLNCLSSMSSSIIITILLGINSNYVTIHNTYVNAWNSNSLSSLSATSRIVNYKHRHQLLLLHRISDHDHNVHNHNNRSCNHIICTSRKKFIQSVLFQSSLLFGVSIVSPNNIVQAVEVEGEVEEVSTASGNVIRPRAPLKALIPATKVHFALKQALALSKEIKITTLGNNSNSNGEDIQPLLSELQDMLFDQQDYAPPKEINIKLPSATIYDRSYADQLKKMSPADVMMALPVQLGERDTAARLKRRQKRLGEKNPVRGAFNYYTSQLQFNTETYVLNATGEDRKKLIRNEGLPDVKSVIVSDRKLQLCIHCSCSLLIL